jgi:hypothetical protein
MNAEPKFSPIVFPRRICRWGRRSDEPLASRHSGACVARTPDAQLRIGESRDSPMWNCTSEVWSCGPSRNDGVGWRRANRRHIALGGGKSRVLGSRAITEHAMSTFPGICLVLYNNDCENCSPITAKSSSVSGNSCERDSHAGLAENRRTLPRISSHHRRGLTERRFQTRPFSAWDSCSARMIVWPHSMAPLRRCSGRFLMYRRVSHTPGTGAGESLPQFSMRCPLNSHSSQSCGTSYRDSPKPAPDAKL